MGEKFADLPEALASTLEVADMCDLKLALGATLLPPFDVPDGLSPDQYLGKLVADGLKWRFGREPRAAARESPAHPRQGIKATRHPSCFLLVWGFYNIAPPPHSVVGAGRGRA